ncbi:hypothetical protein EYC84_010353 [Monilinia fructicola]|uniref:Uncharacterized protein n=1 Tax=Monilinia fructicola TaxID=38448 RepID=A0A5M9JHQ7_MONFR|nr:hypothetical protein EYC84_010353 [Monilinia fructicola]
MLGRCFEMQEREYCTENPYFTPFCFLTSNPTKLPTASPMPTSSQQSHPVHLILISYPARSPSGSGYIHH